MNNRSRKQWAQRILGEALAKMSWEFEFERLAIPGQEFQRFFTAGFPFPGLPGAGTPVRATPNYIMMGTWQYLPGGAIIDGTISQDSGNTGATTTLRPGLIMGKVTSGGKYAPSIYGPTTTTITGSSSTSFTISAAAAAYINARQGASGTLTINGPASSNSTAQSETITYSAINTTTGVVTISTTTNTYEIGSFIGPVDGSQVPMTFIADGFGLYMLDPQTGVANANIQWPQLPIAGTIFSSNLINWPTDTTLQNFIISNLNAASGGQFIFQNQGTNNRY